jgi:hypothetical protein
MDPRIQGGIMSKRGWSLVASVLVFCAVLGLILQFRTRPQGAPANHPAALRENTPTSPKEAQGKPAANPSPEAKAKLLEMLKDDYHITVSGRVVNALGAGIPNAHVRAFLNNMRFDATTDSSGFYRSENAYPKIFYRFIVEADGYCPTGDQRKLGEKDETLNFVLQRAMKISGHAVDTSGAPMPDLKILPVLMTTDPLKQNKRYVSKGTTTAADGSFTLAAIPAGEFGFYGTGSAGKSLFSLASLGAPLEVVEGRDCEDVKVVFPNPQGTIEGHVYNSAGKPVSGVRVAVLNKTRKAGSSMMSDENGFYRLVALDHPSYDLALTSATNDKLSMTVRNIPVGATNADFVFDEPGSISGRVVDAKTHASLSGFEVKVLKVTGPGDSEYGERCLGEFKPGSETGTFTVEGVPAGTAVLYCSVPGHGSITTDVVVEPNITTGPLVLELPEAAIVEGSATANGKPVRFGSVTVEATAVDAPDIVLAHSRLGEGGVFQTDALPAGQYIVRASYCTAPRGAFVYKTQQITLAYGTTTRCDFQFNGSANCHGTVTLPTDVEAVTIAFLDPSATALPTAKAPTPADAAIAYATASKLSGGAYTAQGLPPGTYRVVAYCPDDTEDAPRHSEQAITLNDGDDLQIDFSL